MGRRLHLRKHPSTPRLVTLTMCAQHLELGGGLLCHPTKVETNRQYILSVAQFLGLFGDHPHDYRKEYPSSTLMAPEPTKVYTDLARWGKSPPPTRAPFTLEMLADMHENFASSGLGGPPPY